MENIEITTTSARETQKLAALLAREIKNISAPCKGALVIALEGNLGGGKTTFAQGFARGLGITAKVLSPTFVILKSFKLRAPSFKRFIHIDAYRIERANEIKVLGWQDLANDPENIILVEWTDRIRKVIPKDAIHIAFEFVDEKTRRIYLHYGS